MVAISPTVVFFLFCVTFVACQEATTVSPTNISSTQNIPSSTFESTSVTFSSTSSVNTSCGQYKNCEDCLNNKECYFCELGDICTEYVLKEVLPSNECKLKNAYYGSCKISLLAVIILIAIAASIVFIGLVACCCCCCCRKNSMIRLSKDDLKWARQREERRARAEEKRKERSARTDEIRRKYGLFKDDSSYERFDA